MLFYTFLFSIYYAVITQYVYRLTYTLFIKKLIYFISFHARISLSYGLGKQC